VNLEQLSWLGNILGGLGVIATVIYMSIEIRNNTSAVRASAFQEVVDSFASISFDIGKDKNLTDLFLRTGRNLAELSEVERTQYNFILLSFLRRAESVYFQNEVRTLHERHWSGIRASIVSVMASPGARASWSEIKNRFNPQFSAFIDGLNGSY
jgi:acetaldehyde dehydrogenase (acetylating)